MGLGDEVPLLLFLLFPLFLLLLFLLLLLLLEYYSYYYYRRLWHRVTKCHSGLRQSIVFWVRTIIAVVVVLFAPLCSP